LNKYCATVYGGDFDSVFTVFISGGIALSDPLRERPFPSPGTMLGFLIMTRTATGNNIDIKNVHSVM